MGVLIDIMEEVRLRLQAGIDADAIESSHGGVYVGSKARMLKMNDYPMSGIILPETENVFECMNNGNTERVTIEVGYMIPCLLDDYNVLYNSGSESGPIRNLEQIFNYLKKNRSSGNLDLQLNGTAYDAIKLRSNIQEIPESNLLFFSISIDVKTAKYEGGLM